jgi:hypothetical protein
MEASGQLHVPAALPPGKDPGTYWIGSWVGPRAGLDTETAKKSNLYPCRESNPDHPVRSLVSTPNYVQTKTKLEK